MRLNIYKDLEDQADKLLTKSLIEDKDWYYRYSSNRWYLSREERNKLSSCDFTLDEYTNHKVKKYKGTNYDKYFSNITNSLNAYGLNWFLFTEALNNHYRTRTRRWKDEDGNLSIELYSKKYTKTKSYSITTVSHYNYCYFRKSGNNRNSYKRIQSDYELDRKYLDNLFSGYKSANDYSYWGRRIFVNLVSEVITTYDKKTYKRIQLERSKIKYKKNNDFDKFDATLRTKTHVVENNVEMERFGFTKESFTKNNKLTPTQRKYIAKHFDIVDVESKFVQTPTDIYLTLILEDKIKLVERITKEFLDEVLKIKRK